MEKIGNKYKSKLIMNRKYFVTGLVFLVTAAGFAQGVQMTYEHDEAKMKQITVMESGILIAALMAASGIVEIESS